MRPLIAATALIAFGALPACAMESETPASASRMAHPDAVATLADASGAAKGTASVWSTGHGLRILVHATGLQPGTYGLHIHAVGKCEGPAFASSGAHWNPTMKQHGRDNPAGAHEGDIPNITIGADGSGEVDAEIHGAMLSGRPEALLDADGASVMIHAAADDYRTDPSGNSGARMVCGVFAAHAHGH